MDSKVLLLCGGLFLVFCFVTADSQTAGGVKSSSNVSPVFGTTASLTLVDPLSSEEVQLFSKDSIKYRISTVSAGETYEETVASITLQEGEEMIEMMVEGSPKARYACVLPPEATEEELALINERKATASAAGGEKDMDVVKSLLKPLQGKCLFHLDGWWTYEYCYEKRVLQYHQEKTQNAVTVTAKFVLGQVSDDKEVKQKHRRTVEELISVGNTPASSSSSLNNDNKDQQQERQAIKKDWERGQHYFSVKMNDGSICDLLETPRSVEIRHYCGESPVTMLSSILEPSSCSYVLEVETPLLCKHPAFKPVSLPQKTIRCYTPKRFPGQVESSQTFKSKPELHTNDKVKSVSAQNSAQETSPVSPYTATSLSSTSAKAVSSGEEQSSRLASASTSRTVSTSQRSKATGEALQTENGKSPILHSKLLKPSRSVHQRRKQRRQQQQRRYST